MSDTNVAERLKLFIERKGLSYSQFADMCGIPRPSLSQLLTGRNKKISDILVGQIHNMFPELSIVWLLFGEGQMENEIGPAPQNRYQERENSYDEGLLSAGRNSDSDSKKIVFSPSGGLSSEKMKSQGLRNYAEMPEISDIKVEKLQNKIKELQTQIENLKKNPRKVSHITVYYEDSTFETFFPR